MARSLTLQLRNLPQTSVDQYCIKINYEKRGVSSQITRLWLTRWLSAWSKLYHYGYSIPNINSFHTVSELLVSDRDSLFFSPCSVAASSFSSYTFWLFYISIRNYYALSRTRVVWPGGVMVRALDSRLKGRRFDSRPFRLYLRQVVHTHVRCLNHEAT